MKRFSAALTAVMLLSLLAGVVPAAKTTADDDTQNLPGEPAGMRRVMGTVEAIDLKAKKLAIQVKTEENPDGERLIFKLDDETRVREEQNVKTLQDIRKNQRVLVFWKASTEKTQTAALIRVFEDGRDLPRRPRRP